MGFEPTNLRDLVGRSNYWATGEQGWNVGLWLELPSLPVYYPYQGV